jgi:hypothetical protein
MSAEGVIAITATNVSTDMDFASPAVMRRNNRRIEKAKSFPLKEYGYAWGGFG